MKKALFGLSLAAVVLTALSVGSLVARAEEDGDEPELTLKQAASAQGISLDEAVRRALAAHPGIALEAEFERGSADSDSLFVYEVEILAEDTFLEVVLEPLTGRVLGIEIEDEAEDEAEHSSLRTAAASAKISLVECIAKAEAEGRGRILAAHFELDDGEVVCEAWAAGERRFYEIEYSALDGALLEIEAERRIEDED